MAARDDTNRVARWTFSIPQPRMPLRSAWRRPRAASTSLRKSVDLFAATALIVLASLGAILMPASHPLRTVAVLGFLLLVPGYLLLQAVVIQERPHRFEPAHALAAVGISPAVVGLLALSTTLAPVGFRTSTAFAVIVLASVLFAIVAFARRTARLRGHLMGPRESGR